MRYIATILILLVTFFTTPAAALELKMGEDIFLTNYYRVHTYHESHPDSDIVNSPGGWVVGLSIDNADVADDIDEVHIIANSTPNGVQYTYVQTLPSVYFWVWRWWYDFRMWFSRKGRLSDPFEIKVWNDSEGWVGLKLEDGSVVQSLFVSPSLTAASPPVCEIKNMKIKNDGRLMVKFTAPDDTRENHIRI